MITQEDKLSIVKLYNEGSSLSELSRLFTIDTTVIKSILCEYNIHIRTRGEQTRLTNMKRSKSVDNFYFSNIDTVNKVQTLEIKLQELQKDNEELWENIDALSEDYTTIWIQLYGEDSWYESPEDKEKVHKEIENMKGE